MSLNMEKYRVEILDLIEHSMMKVLNLGANVVLENQTYCPACRNELVPICIFFNKNREQKIRFGVCQHCGYMGYIDRPTQKWIADYYSAHWDKNLIRGKEDILKAVDLPVSGNKATRYLALSLVKGLYIDKERPVCEIGCGYGEVLKNFENIGFKKLVGVENSKHRAELVCQIFNFNVLDGEFENYDLQKKLASLGPFSLIFSHHVLEHTYNPAEVIEKASRLQNEGDYLILALPNAKGEHINFLFYLPHLHSFTKESLEKILNRYGYEIFSDNSDDANISIAAKKVADPKPKFALENNYYDAALRRIKNGLGITSMKDSRLRHIFWDDATEDLSDVYSISRPLWYWLKFDAFVRTKLLHRFSHKHSFIARLPRVKYNSIDSAPFEIQFSGNIKLLVK